MVNELKMVVNMILEAGREPTDVLSKWLEIYDTALSIAAGQDGHDIVEMPYVRNRGNFTWGKRKRAGVTTTTVGEDNPMTSYDVERIRKRYAAGEVTIGELAREYGRARSTVYSILRGNSWKEAGGPIHHGVPARKLRPSDVEEIRESYAKGQITQEELGERYGVTSATISSITNGNTWKRAGGPRVVSTG